MWVKGQNFCIICNYILLKLLMPFCRASEDAGKQPMNLGSSTFKASQEVLLLGK
jgi:hypothetical protein